LRHLDIDVQNVKGYAAVQEPKAGRFTKGHKTIHVRVVYLISVLTTIVMMKMGMRSLSGVLNVKSIIAKNVYQVICVGGVTMICVTNVMHWRKYVTVVRQVCVENVLKPTLVVIAIKRDAEIVQQVIVAVETIATKSSVVIVLRVRAREGDVINALSSSVVLNVNSWNVVKIGNVLVLLV